MVAPTKTEKRMKSGVSKEEENIQSGDLHCTDEILLRRIELGLSIFRQKIKFRVERCQELLEKLDQNSAQMKVCFLQLMEALENTRKLISNEKEENLQLLQVLDGDCIGKADMPSKIRTVHPMTDGYPLKRATISLKRLDPSLVLHNHNNSRVIIADSWPASDIGFSHPTSNSSLQKSVHLCHQIPPNSSDNQRVAPSDSVLSRYRRGCRKWHRVPNNVSSTVQKDFHLKRASISLKRVNPNPHLPAKDISEVLSSQNMSLQGGEIENGIFESVHTVHTSERTAQSENADTIQSEKKCVKCRPLQSNAIVVLKRLRQSPGLRGANSENTTSLSSNSAPCNGIKTCRTHSVCSGMCEENVENRSECENKDKGGEQPSEEPYECPISTLRKTRPQSCTADLKNHFNSSKINYVRRAKKTENCRNNVGKKKKVWVTNKRTVETQFTLSSNAKCSEKKMDEDPLEGPSWLYKDGVLRKAKLRKLKKIREGYLTPLYFLPPTIYSSTDESGDETSNKLKKKNAKLRKKKEKK